MYKCANYDHFDAKFTSKAARDAHERQCEVPKTPKKKKKK